MKITSRRAQTAGEDGETFVFTTPGTLEYRGAGQAFISQVCRTLTGRGVLTEDAGHRVISAFIEAFNNAVIHAYGDASGGPVTVELLITGDRLQMTVSDRGRPFAPESVPKPDLDMLPEGGLGLFIIESFMDEVSYVRSGGKNVLTMAKHIAIKGNVGDKAEVDGS